MTAKEMKMKTDKANSDTYNSVMLKIEMFASRGLYECILEEKELGIAKFDDVISKLKISGYNVEKNYTGKGFLYTVSWRFA